jgi:hypothetical protein
MPRCDSGSMWSRESRRNNSRLLSGGAKAKPLACCAGARGAGDCLTTAESTTPRCPNRPSPRLEPTQGRAKSSHERSSLLQSLKAARGVRNAGELPAMVPIVATAMTVIIAIAVTMFAVIIAMMMVIAVITVAARVLVIIAMVAVVVPAAAVDLPQFLDRQITHRCLLSKSVSLIENTRNRKTTGRDTEQRSYVCSARLEEENFLSLVGDTKAQATAVVYRTASRKLSGKCFSITTRVRFCCWSLPTVRRRQVEQ